ncbi:MAG: putative redox protein [Bacteroidetes bacterium]|nr:MAG: putative redox protein [Bacteroidota bacterium]
MNTTNPNTPVQAPAIEATLSLVNSKLHITGQAGNFEPIDTDYIPPYGDGLGYMPLQLFLISFGACAAGAVLTLLRRMQRNIEAFDMNVSGIRRTEHPTSFSEITVEYIITSNNVTEQEVQKVLALAEQSICPVWAMIKGNVEVKSMVTIL